MTYVWPPRQASAQPISTKEGLRLMRVSLTTAEVRDIVLRVLERHHAAVQDVNELEERIRISDGRRVAHVFRTDGHMAMWMIEVGILQFYDAEGNMLETINLMRMSPAGRVAA
jgi:hypothetical protein